MKRRKFLIDITIASAMGSFSPKSNLNRSKTNAFPDDIILENGLIKISISKDGRIKQIDYINSKYSHKICNDFFIITTGDGVFSNQDIKSFHVEKSSGSVSLYFPLTQHRTVCLNYILKPGASYFRRSLIISKGKEPLALLNIVLGNTSFSKPPKQVLVYNTFWNASTVTFLRWEKNGLFCGIENPFFKTTQSDDEALCFQYEPSLILKADEQHSSDAQFIGIYTTTGKQISDHYPQTVKGNYPRYRNPDGHKPLDLNEIKAMRKFVDDFMNVSLKDFKFINYHFFYPLPQMPVPGSAEEETILNVVKTFHELGGDLFIFNPMFPYAKPNSINSAGWELGPKGSSADKIMDEARSLNISFGYYMGVARHGLEGNASALPFMPEKKDWKKSDELGQLARENCMGCDEFADWWFKVQNNTIEKYALKLWSWDPGPGNGKFCYNEKHGHLAGKGEYKGWRNATELMRQLKEKHPDLFLMAFYGRKEYGLWGFKYFDQHESYWEQTVPYQASIHPDLHADRVNADGIRLQAWWNQNFRFMPPQINHVLAHRIQEGYWDTKLPKAWDHLGWKYSVMSALACGGGIMTVILPDNIKNVKGMKEFYGKWLKWGKDNFYLAKYNVPFGEQLRAGAVDCWARIHKGKGFIFLCNQNPRPAKTNFDLSNEIGVNQEGPFTLHEIYPGNGGYFFDKAHPNGLFKQGESIECVVPAYQIVLMEFSFAGKSFSADIPSKNILNKHISDRRNAPVRALDSWVTQRGERFNFPFNKSASDLALTTTFFANGEIQDILKLNRPLNLNEYESLIPEWKKNYPDNFAWCRPDRLWFVLPSVNAAKLQNPKLILNGKDVPVESQIITSRPIINYADITDFIEWNANNKLELNVAGIEENQFMGPYLDYPEQEQVAQEKEDVSICSILPALYANAVIYDKPIDPEMPVRITQTGDPVYVIESAKMTPCFLKEEQVVTISVKLKVPKEDVNQVWISLPSSDTPMNYKQGNEWVMEFKCPEKREGIIMDVSLFRVWAVLNKGLISEPFDIPVKWLY